MSADIQRTQTPSGLRLVLPMREAHHPIPHLIGSLPYGLPIIMLPLWLLGSVVIRRLFRIPKPPRAEILLTEEELYFRMQRPSANEISELRFAPSSLREFRRNRFCAGIYLHVAGATMETILDDVPEETLGEVIQVVNSFRTAGGLIDAQGSSRRKENT